MSVVDVIERFFGCILYGGAKFSNLTETSITVKKYDFDCVKTITLSADTADEMKNIIMGLVCFLWAEYPEDPTVVVTETENAIVQAICDENETILTNEVVDSIREPTVENWGMIASILAMGQGRHIEELLKIKCHHNLMIACEDLNEGKSIEEVKERFSL